MALSKYSPTKNENYEILPKETISLSDIKHFRSGIGDNLDLSVYIKGNDDNYLENIELKGDIYGLYKKIEKKPKEISFSYRAKASGTYLKDVREGFLKFNLKAYPIVKINFTVTKKAERPVKLKWFIKAAVGYYKDSGRYNGDIKILEPVTKFIESPKYEYSFFGPVELSNKIKLNNLSVKDLLKPVIDNDIDIISSKNLGYDYVVNYYEIYSNYIFDDSLTYDHTNTNTWQIGNLGSVKIIGDRDVKGHLIDTSFVYAYGSSEGQYYKASKDFTKSFLFKDIVTKDLILSSDLALNKKLQNISGEFVDETEQGITTEVKVNSTDRDLSIIGTPNPGDAVVLRGTCTAKFNIIDNVPLTYNFDDSFPQTDIIFTNLFEESFQGGSERYYLELDVVDVSDNIYIYDEMHMPVRATYGLKLIYNSEDTYDLISVEARYKTVLKKYEEIYPPINEIPWYGAVNTNNTVKDFNFTLPFMSSPENVQTMQYEIITDNINPSDAALKMEFKSTSRSNVTIINGDVITFSSNHSYLNIEDAEEIVSRLSFKNIMLQNNMISRKNFEVDNTSFINSKYSSYKIKLYSDNPNVNIYDYDNVLSFNGSKANIELELSIDESALSFINPKVRNGYYYINQNEYYLYSQSDIKGNYIKDTIEKIKDDFISYNLAVDFNQVLTESSSSVNLNNFGSFIDNKEHIEKFSYDEASKTISPKPSIDSEYHTRYENTVEYISNVIYLGPSIKSLNTITFTKTLLTNTNAKLYLSTFDESTLTFSSWVEAPVSGISISSLKASSFIRFKIVFTNYTTYIQDPIEEMYSSSPDFEKDINHNESSNVKIYQNKIECINPLLSGVFVSRVYDYGTAVPYAIHINFRGNAKLYISCSDDNITFTDWTIYTTTVNARYIKYKIELYNDAKVYRIYKNIILSKINTVRLAKLGDIIISYTATNSFELKNIRKTISKTIPFDQAYYTLTSNLLNDLKTEIYSLGFSESDVKTVTVTNNSMDRCIIESTNSITTSIRAKSINKLTEDTFTEFISVSNNTFETSPAPEQFSPIIIEDDLGVIYAQVHFVDENLNPSLYFNDIQTSKGQRIFILTYQGADVSTIEVYNKDNIEITTGFTKAASYIKFDDIVNDGELIKIKYKLSNSFITVVDDANDKVTFTINSSRPLTKVKVKYETNKISSKKQIDSVSLNTLYNPINEGFLYIDYKQKEPFRVNIYANPYRIKADGLDVLKFFIEVLDKDNNPIPNEKINVSALTGSVETKEYITDIYGITYGTYKSSVKALDTLKAQSQSKTSLESSIKINCI